MRKGAPGPHLGRDPDSFHEFLTCRSGPQRRFGVALNAVGALRYVRDRNRNVCFTFDESAPSANTFCPKASNAAWTSGASSRRFCIVSRVVGGYIDSDTGFSCSALLYTSLTSLPIASGAISVSAPPIPRIGSKDNCAHVFSCRLAYHLDAERLAPMLYEDDDRAIADALRDPVRACSMFQCPGARARSGRIAAELTMLREQIDEVQGQVAVVTGRASGIGKEIAQRLQTGPRWRSPSEPRGGRGDCDGFDGHRASVPAVAMDVTSESRSRWTMACCEQFGGRRYSVSNAGIKSSIRGQLHDFADWKWTVIHLDALLIILLLSLMYAQGRAGRRFTWRFCSTEEVIRTQASCDGQTSTGRHCMMQVAAKRAPRRRRSS